MIVRSVNPAFSIRAIRLSYYKPAHFWIGLARSNLMIGWNFASKVQTLPGHMNWFMVKWNCISVIYLFFHSNYIQWNRDYDSVVQVNDSNRVSMERVFLEISKKLLTWMLRKTILIVWIVAPINYLSNPSIKISVSAATKNERWSYSLMLRILIYQ